MCFAWCQVLSLMGGTDSRMVTRIQLGKGSDGGLLGPMEAQDWDRVWRAFWKKCSLPPKSLRGRVSQVGCRSDK